MIKYLKNSLYELRNNVSWTKRAEAQKLLVVVTVFSLLFSLAVWGIDSLLTGIISKYFDLVK